MRRITVRVQKTIQERQYEPFVLSLESSIEIDDTDMAQADIDNFIEDEYVALCNKQDDLLYQRENEEL